MKRFLKWLAIAGPSVVLAVTIAPVLYALLGGGLLGGLACMLLGMTTYWACETTLNNAVALYRWHRDRIDWTKDDKDGKL